MPRARRIVTLLSAVALLTPAIVGVSAGAAQGETVASGAYAAVIRRTSYGVPHVLPPTSATPPSGRRWAYAEDRFCDLAGPDREGPQRASRWFGAGPDGATSSTDFAYQSLGLVDRARDQLTTAVQRRSAILNGYVRGYNAFLAATGAARVPGWCAGQPWIAPITAVDVWRTSATSRCWPAATTAGAVPRPPHRRALRRRLPIGAGRHHRRAAGPARGQRGAVQQRLGASARTSRRPAGACSWATRTSRGRANCASGSRS